jgi:hypothetical protein
MLSGQNGCYFSSNASEGLLLLKKHQRLKNNLRTKVLKYISLSLRTFQKTEFKILTIQFKSFFRFTTQPNMIFQIRDSWPLTITSPIKLKNTETNTKGTKKSRRDYEKKVISRRNHELQFKNISIVHECD